MQPINTVYKNKFKEKKCCVIIPTYNNAGTIKSVIYNVLDYCEDVYVVNDGSTDNTPTIMDELGNSIRSIHIKKNRGKGNALIKGFRKAIEDGFEYAISIDSDGQHFAHDLPTFLDKLEQETNAVIIGARRLNNVNRSAGSSFANKFSNFWFRVETGYSVSDTQSGFRLYPLAAIKKTKFYTKKYEFEVEIIVRLCWKGCKILTVPIDVFYPDKEQRISHFRPFKDFTRISILNTVLVILALLFFLPRNVARKYRKKKIKQIIKEDIIGTNTPTHIIAISIGFGVFMGIVPIWGYQLIVGLILAHFLKLKKGIIFISSNISLPPMIPFIVYLSYVLGGFMLGKGTWAISIDDVSLETINIKQYVIGSLLLATIAGSFVSIVSYFLLLIPNRKKKS